MDRLLGSFPITIGESGEPNPFINPWIIKFINDKPITILNIPINETTNFDKRIFAFFLTVNE
ncbi:hypothetical protein I8F96_06310 [Enterococcus casseliflavus]|nr:hypothetical protein [Enterococcus casseliflavus]